MDKNGEGRKIFYSLLKVVLCFSRRPHLLIATNRLLVHPFIEFTK